MFDIDLWLVIRCLIFLIATAGFYFGSYLVIRAYRKTLEKTAYLVGFVFIVTSAFILLVMTVPIF